MPVIHISEADALRDPASLFSRVREGFEVIVEGEGKPIAWLAPPLEADLPADPDHDAWFVKEVEASLADPRPSIDSETVEAYFAKRRRECALKAAG